MRPLLVAAALAFSLAGTARALDMPAAPSERVNDYAGILTPQARSAIERRLAAFESESSNQIVVAVFPSLDEESLEDFTNRLFERWKLGQTKLDNGVLLAIFVKDRKARLEVGYGLEHVLTDAKARRILADELSPRFREGDYAGGIEAAAEAVIAVTRGTYKGKPRRRNNQINPWILVLLIAVPLTLAILRGLSQGTTYTSQGKRRSRRSSWGGGTWGGGFGGGGGGFSGGGGGFSGGGGGFSGGGGMSGGGGASGSW